MDRSDNREFFLEQEIAAGEGTEQHREPESRPADPTFPVSQQYTAPQVAEAKKPSPFANSPYLTYDQGYRAPAAARYSTSGQLPQQAAPQIAPAAPAREKRNRKPIWKTVLAVSLAMLLAVASCLTAVTVVNSEWQARMDRMTREYDSQLDSVNKKLESLQQQIAAGTAEGSVPGSPVSSGDWLTPTQVYARNVDAVVMVHSQITYASFGQSGTGESTGSGFVISRDGYVLTNYHVVEGASTVSIAMHNGESYTAQIVGYDETNDVALLKADGSELPVVTLGSSSALNVGDQVVAIGNPLGELTSTMTVGYISGKERSVTTDGTTINMIQTDAAINSGNSGGPLFNMKGEVVGITTAKYSGETSSGASIEGIGFAIPIDDVMDVVDELKEFGYIKTAYMGVVVWEMNQEMQAMAELYNLPVGLYVDSTEADGPAHAAGVVAEDIIVALGGTRVTNLNELTRALRQFDPGDTTTITVLRQGRELELTITLTEKPRSDSTLPEEDNLPGSDMPSDGSYEEWYEYFAPFFGTKPKD